MYDSISKETMIKEYFGCELSAISKTVIISPILKLEKFRQYAEEIVDEFEGWYNGITVKYKGQEISILSSGIGSPLTGDCVLALKYTDCEKLLFSGSAGAVNSEYCIGDMLAVGEAVIGEGFSRYHTKSFMEDSFGRLVRGDDTMTELLYAAIKPYKQEYSVNTYKGRIFTTDSILGETKEAFDYMVSKGCDAVEMEVSAVFTAAQKANIKAAALIFISDLPLKSKSLFEGRDNRDYEQHRRQKNEIPRLLLEIAKKI